MGYRFNGLYLCAFTVNDAAVRAGSKAAENTDAEQVGVLGYSVFVTSNGAGTVSSMAVTVNTLRINPEKQTKPNKHKMKKK